MISTSMVCTVDIAPAVRLGIVWDGGAKMAIHVSIDGATTRVGEWDVWSPEWDSPLIQSTRDSFERYVRLRIGEPGLVEQLVAMAAA